MEELNSVAMESGVIETPTADGQGDAGAAVVNAVDLLLGGTDDDQGQGETGEQAAPQATEPQAAQQAAAAPEPRTYTQAEFDAAIRQKVGHIERSFEERLQSNNFWQMGKQLAEMQAMQDGVSPEIAAQRVLAEGFQRQAEALAADPVALSRAVLASQIGMNAPPPVIQAPQPMNPMQAEANALAQGIADCVASGELPPGFNFQATMQAHPGFLTDCQRYGVPAAAALLAERTKNQQQQTRAAQNRALPQSMRPHTNVQAPGQIDYSKLSDEQFDSVLNGMQREHLRGREVLIN